MNPPVVLKGQLDVFEARAVRLASVATALHEARFADALAAARAHAHESALHAALQSLVEMIQGNTLADEPHRQQVLQHIDDAGPATVGTAARRGVWAHLARDAERLGPSPQAARHWLAALRPEEAQRVLLACINVRVEAPLAHCMLGQMAWDAGDVARARAHFRSAFWLDGGSTIPVTSLPDPAIIAACEEAGGLVPAPALRWLPLVGVALRLWPVGPCEADDPDIPPARFHAALIRSRTASRAGRVDISARREMKDLAPELLARLLEEGLA